MVILKIIFTIFILIFPLAEIGRVSIAKDVAISLNDLMLGLVIISWFRVRVVAEKKIPSGFLLKPLLIFIFICFISLVLNFTNLKIDQIAVAFLYLLRFMAYALLYFIVKSFDAKFKERIPKLLFTSGLIVLVFGYVQYFFYPSLRNLYYLGWDEHLYRMFSSFLDPNFAGAFFVLFLLLSLYFINKTFRKNNLVKVIPFILTSTLSLIAVYLTYSRSALIMLLTSVLVFLGLKNMKKYLVGFLVIFVLLIFLSPKAFKTEGTNLLRTFSSIERIKSAEIALKVFGQNPILGVGFNSYRYAQQKITKADVVSNLPESHAGAGTDNSFLFVLATTGVLGLSAYLVLIYNIGKLAYINIKKNTIAIVLLTSLIGLTFNSLFINSLFYVLILEWIFIYCGLIENN